MKRMMTFRKWLAAGIAFLTVAGAASAVELTFTNRGAWNTAVGGAPDFVEDFSGSSGTISFDPGSPHDAGPFTLEHTGTDAANSNLNDVLDANPGGFGDFNVNGSRYAAMFIDSDDSDFLRPPNSDITVDLVLDTPAAAWGADFSLANDDAQGDVHIELYDPVNTLINTLDLNHLSEPGFFGFTTDHPTGVKRIVFISSTDAGGGNEFGMDDVSAAAMLAATDTPPVAAPTSVPDVGLAGMGATTYSLDITYTDDSAIDVSTLGASDITISGPGGSLTIVSATPDVGSDGTPRVVTYQCTPPGGSWDFGDNGTYTVAIAGSEVADDGTPQFVAADATFATFNVLTGSGFATAFSDMGAFESAIGGAAQLDFMIDFEDYPADDDFSSINPIVDVPFTAPRVATLGHSGPNDFTNNIEVLPFPGFPTQHDPNGTNYAHLFVDGDDPNTVEMIFDTPVAAWGAMLRGAANDEDLEIDLYDTGGTLLDSLEHDADGFYGFTSPSPGTVKRIVFKAAGPLGPAVNNAFGMDDMKGAYTYTVNLDPVIASVTAADVTIPDTGQTSYDIILEFSDNSAIDVSTLDAGDITVTGPGAIGTLTVTGVTEPTGTDGTPRFATYTVTPPGGSWDLADNGTYTIAINGGEVFDDTADPVAANATLATFVVEARSNVVTDFTSKPGWTSAIGGTPDWQEDFESFATPNEDFSSAPVVSPTPGGGQFSVVRVGGSSTFGNFVDADPANNVGEETSAPLNYAAMFVDADSGLTVEMTFDNPLLGWIGEFSFGAPEENIEIEVHDAGGIIDLLDINTNGYHGFTVPTPVVTKLVFRGEAPNLSSGGEVFGLDNICAQELPAGDYTIDVNGTTGDLEITDTTGDGNMLMISVSGGNLVIMDPGGVGTSETVAIGSFTGDIVIDGGTGNDTVKIDLSGGDPGSDIVIDGGKSLGVPPSSD